MRVICVPQLPTIVTPVGKRKSSSLWCSLLSTKRSIWFETSGTGTTKSSASWNWHTKEIASTRTRVVGTRWRAAAVVLVVPEQWRMTTDKVANLFAFVPRFVRPQSSDLSGGVLWGAAAFTGALFLVQVWSRLSMTYFFLVLSLFSLKKNVCKGVCSRWMACSVLPTCSLCSFPMTVFDCAAAQSLDSFCPICHDRCFSGPNSSVFCRSSLLAVLILCPDLWPERVSWLLQRCFFLRLSMSVALLFVWIICILFPGY